ncbi:MAG: hypothetical protein ACYS7Y_04410 [Planctomycetota bacterium]|jgi:hypothetical protein
MNDNPIGTLLMFAVFILGAVMILSPSTREGITERNYDRIESGMPLREVSDLMGEAGALNGPPKDGMIILRWEDESIEILVYVIDGLVYHKCLWVDGEYRKQKGGYTPDL